MKKFFVFSLLIIIAAFLQSTTCKASQNYFEDTVWVKKVPNFGTIDNIQFSKNDSLIVARGYGTNIFFEAKNGNEIKRVLSYAPIQFFNNDENFVQIATSNDRLEIYQTSNFKAIDTLEYKTDSIISILVSKDEKYVIGVLKDGFCAWDLKTHKILKTITFPEEEYLRSMECTIQNLCDNNTFLASFFKIYTDPYPPYKDYKKISYNTYNYSDLDSISSKEGTGFCRLSNNCEILAKNISDSNFGVELINFNTGELIQKLPINGYSLTGMEFSPDDKYLITSNASGANSLIIWEIKNGKEVHRYWPSSYGCTNTSNNKLYITGAVANILRLFKSRYNVVSVPEKEKITKIIYPNPTSGLATIEFELMKQSKVTIELLNIEGTVIKNLLSKFLDVGMQKIEIITYDISSGSYFLVVQSQQEKFIFQLIVSH
ncbi:MAG TPA: T9SS type A sorting domain-containing protein [Candidatus Kapabacteria bacterium]|nr:T9SS type A sorting domain-containing protein [Candidatus Kapabacteria bacterium]